MQRLVFILCSMLAWLFPLAAAENAFFIFDNGVGRGSLSIEQQAAFVTECGYAGIGFSGIGALAERQKAFDAANSQIVSLYVNCELGNPPTCDKDLLPALPLLKGRSTVLWLTVRGKGDDDAAAAAVRLVADPATALGITVVIYPHYGFRIATMEQALTVVKKINNPLVGVSFNLCHELRAGNEKRFEALLAESAPWLKMVSIHGAEHDGGWDKLIKPLGVGAFDVLALLRTLRTINYQGPIGLQCYNVKGDQRTNALQSMTAWQGYLQALQ